MTKHTNLPNEITGKYHNEKMDWIGIIGGLFVLIIVLFVLADLIFGAENVTNYIASFFSYIINAMEL